MNLSPKVVLHRANTMKSALGFFSAYREYLLTGELANAVSPIIAKVDAGETMPSQALPQVAQAIFEHVCVSDRAKLVEKKTQQDQRVSTAQAVKEEKAEKAEKTEKEETTPKPWQARIVNEAGEVQTRINAKGEEVDLSKGFDHASDADRWTDRRLFEGASNWHGEITHSSMNIATVIERSDAIARMLKMPKGPSYHQKSMTTASLGNKMHCKQDHARFSHG